MTMAQMKQHLLTMAWFALSSVFMTAAEPPNILWLTSEDNGPQLGCYGDGYAVTPHLDALAAKGMIYLNVWSVAPVCAPARTALISGMYPSSTGAENMRSEIRLPAGMKMFPQFLRKHGYYCSNNSKEDYNLIKPGKVWDDSSTNGHWRNRPPGQPFFAVFNFTQSHESQIRKRPHSLKHDPTKAPLPSYHPDTPEVRQDWAQYYDQITVIDAKAGKRLRELDAAGLADDTIVFYFGDHGAGLPRSKRSACNSGLRVPLIVYVPPKLRPLAPKDYRPGGKSERLVSFVDFAPTVLSLAGVESPAYFQGRAFMGKQAGPAPKYLHGLRGRMDERYDLVRSVFDGRYVYVRNFMPHRPHGQYVAYMFETPTTRVWKQLFDEGKLSPAQRLFWMPKPPEELYDLFSDPDEVRNLAGSSHHQAILRRLRKARQDHAKRIRDLGLLPEDDIHRRAQDTTPYAMGRNDGIYPFKKILAAAELASSLRPEAIPALQKSLRASDSAVRYWAAMGLLMRGREAVQNARKPLRAALGDVSPSVRTIAAEALSLFGSEADLAPALTVLIEAADLRTQSVHTSILALNALDELDRRASAVRGSIAALPGTNDAVVAKMRSYVPRLIEKTLADLEH